MKRRVLLILCKWWDCVKLYFIYLQADVYVNTTNTKLDLSSGAVSQLLLKLGGPDLQAECNKKGSISVGEVAVTGGGKLECRHIFHVVIPRYDGPEGQAEKVTLTAFFHCKLGSNFYLSLSFYRY